MSPWKIFETACQAATRGERVRSRAVLKRLSKRQIGKQLGQVVRQAMDTITAMEIQTMSGEQSRARTGLTEKFDGSPIKIAIVTGPSRVCPLQQTLLFGHALARDGCVVQHFVLTDRLIGDPANSKVIHIGDAKDCKEAEQITRSAIDRFEPSCVVIDCNGIFIPLAVRAARHCRYILWNVGSEMIFPLKKLAVPPGNTSANHKTNQPGHLARSDRYLAVYEPPLDSLNGGLRGWYDLRSAKYQDELQQALWEAQDVIVSDPAIHEMCVRHCRSVRIAPPGAHPDLLAKRGHRRERCMEPSLDPVFLLIVGPGKKSEALREFLDGLDGLARAMLWNTDDWQTNNLPTNNSKDPTEPDSFLDDLLAADIVLVLPACGPEISFIVANAMASGCAIVAPSTSEITFLIEDRKTGLIFDPQASDDWTSLVSPLISDPLKRSELGVAARSVARRRLDWDRLMERIYRPVLVHPLCPADKGI